RGATNGNSFKPTSNSTGPYRNPHARRLKLSAVGKQFPAARAEGCVNPATVWRWAHEGAKTPTGERVKLEVVRVGMSWLTSQAALDRFVVALTSASTPSAGGRDIKIPNP